MNSKNKIVFLDRDGTINMDYEYVYKIEDFEFLPGAIEALKLLTSEDFKIFIITNQSGIGRKYYTEEDYQKLNEYMLHEFKKEGIKIAEVYHDAKSPEDNSPNRKPEPGMVEKAIKEHKLDIEGAYIIGDKTSDIELGNRINEKLGYTVKKILVQTGKAGQDKRFPTAQPHHIAKNLLEATQWILKNE